jgi:CDP-paratose 2-epimerase
VTDVVIFGTGSTGERAWEAAAARTDVRVVCFADNDVRRRGSVLHERPVVGPADLSRTRWDFIIVASMYAADILRQLEALGFDMDRVLAPEPNAFSNALGELASRRSASTPVALDDGTSILRPELPQVLILTYETLNMSHGTGVLLQRFFGDFPAGHLFSVCHTAAGQPWLENTLVLPAGAGPADARAVTLASQLQARGVRPDLVYATAFNENDLELLECALGALPPGVPVIQHFMDYMPHDAAVFDARFRMLLPRIQDVWALTEGMARELGRRYERPVRLVTALHQDPPATAKRVHRQAGSGFRTAMLGNLWQPWTLPVIRRIWQRCRREVPDLAPIDWYVHPARVQAVVEGGYDLGDEIVWRGFHTGQALQERLQAADLALLPFNTDAAAADGYTRFSLPSRLTELCGAGLPIVAMASPDTEPARFIAARGCGLAASAADEEAFATALLDLIRDPLRRASLGARARQVAETELSLEPFHTGLISSFVRMARTPRAARAAEGSARRVDPVAQAGHETSGDTPMRVLVTGSSGLIGSEAVAYFAALGAEIVGVDNNMRARFFGSDGDTRWNQRRLESEYSRFTHRELDIRNRDGVLRLIQDEAPDLVVHCAAQPSHDLAARVPFDDFDVNAVGTLNLLEAVRRHRPEAVFVMMSTNKVYGDAPNELPLVEQDTRWEYADAAHFHGIDESFRIDRTLHSLFGASKVAADVMAQEYGRYFGLKVGVFRGGCLTGPQHSGVELHGFLSYLVKAAMTGATYRIYGYKGKQVRDNIHCRDVLRAVHCFYEAPRPGEVYNLGGGRANSCSLLEAAALVRDLGGGRLRTEYVDQNRRGDHICYISDLRKFQTHYPRWSVEVPLAEILRQIIAGWERRNQDVLPVSA